uniref:Tc1-like transposase DDE domain-containing protein n=1 Tax=Graphocephala atropunctata TaxID=36148 RepID=A0A1B6KPA7_9HEMI
MQKSEFCVLIFLSEGRGHSFLGCTRVIHIDYLEKGKTITGEYYSALKRFDNDLKQKQPHMAKKKVLFQQDNARVHTCLVTMAKIHKLGYELLPHPAYSPDLAPCDYFLIPNLKKWLGDKENWVK